MQICTVCNLAPTLGGVTSIPTTERFPDPALGTSLPPEGQGRRELNKARTREAIITALHDLALERSVEQVTVDQLAEAAGISRRTFFNYFPSIQAVISEVIGSHTEHLAAAMGRLTPGVSPFEAVRRLIAEVGIPTALLDWFTVLNCHLPRQDHGGPVGLERAIWAEKGAWLEAQLRARLPEGTDDLYVATLADTIMGCFAAAEKVWLAGRDHAAPLDDASVAAFHAELDRALGYAARGWLTPAEPDASA